MTTLAEINKTLMSTQEAIEQTASSSADVAKYLKKWVEGEEKDKLDKLEKDKKQERAASRTKSQPTSLAGAFGSGFREQSGYNFFADFISNTMGSVIGNLTDQGWGLKIATWMGSAAARGMVFAPLAAAVHIFAEGILVDLFDNLDPQDVFADDTKGSIAASLSDATRNGLLAAIVSKRFGMATFFGTLVGDALSGAFDLSNDENASLFGFELPISEQDFAMWGSTIAAYFAPSLITNSINSQLSGRPTVGRDPVTGRFTKLDPKLASSFRANFIPRLGWATVISGAGGIIANVVADQFADPDVQAEMESTIGGTFNAAAFGLMLAGPWGALATSIGYLAVVGLNKLANWMRGQDEKVRQAAFDGLRQYENVDLSTLSPQEVEQARLAAATAQTEASRVADLARTTPEQRAEALQMEQLATDISAALPDANIGNMIAAAQLGNQEAMDNAIRFLYEKMNVAPTQLADELMGLSTLGFNEAIAFGEQGAQRWQDLYNMTMGDGLAVPTTGMWWWKERDYNALLPPARNDVDNLQVDQQSGGFGIVAGQIGDTKIVNNSSSQGFVIDPTIPAADPFAGGASFSIIGR